MRKCAWQEAGDRNYMSQARSAAHIQSFMGAEVHRLPQKIVSSVGETYGCPTGHPVKKIKENSLICRNRGEVFAASARRKFPALITIRERKYIKAPGRRGFDPPINLLGTGRTSWRERKG